MVMIVTWNGKESANISFHISNVRYMCTFVAFFRIGHLVKSALNCQIAFNIWNFFLDLKFKWLRVAVVWYIIVWLRILLLDTLSITLPYFILKNKLKSLKVANWRKDDEGWMKNDEWWKKYDEGWWFQAVQGFCRLTDKQTNGQTFLKVESLLWLKKSFNYSCTQILYSKFLNGNLPPDSWRSLTWNTPSATSPILLITSSSGSW